MKLTLQFFRRILRRTLSPILRKSLISRRTFNRCILFVTTASVLSGMTLAITTYVSLRDVASDILSITTQASHASLIDRNGETLTVTYQNEWNVHDKVLLHDVPPLLLQAFIFAEDQRFYSHTGVDWLARVNAIKQNVQHGQRVRGASTITEQVIKMVHKRPRKLWSRWLEGFEAKQLEEKLTKLQILEFYVNQVPYAARRRGIVQGAHYYFGRDLSSLNEKEMLALAVMVRAPSILHPLRNAEALENRIAILHARMLDSGINLLSIDKQALGTRDAESESDIVDVSHLFQYLQKNTSSDERYRGKIYTTIDKEVQAKAQKLLDQRLSVMRNNNVNNGAMLVVDHQLSEIIAWVVGRAGDKNTEGGDFDAVTVKRQPGSTLKPFVYAAAMDMEHPWTAATMIDDSPLQQSVGKGMHEYHNYSRAHYGEISLREALANSLNIPAVKAAQFVGSENVLVLLRRLGLQSLHGHPNVYGDGLALGNGEISLLELVQAYSVLARMGEFSSLSVKHDPFDSQYMKKHHVISENVASIIGNILSDPHAREKEFGAHSILNFPYQTAVKTGTSSDYRDAWAMGYNDRYTVGVWMGNMDYQPMEKVTGSTGPAIVLRSIFNELNRHREVKPLVLSRSLEKHRVCVETGLAFHHIENACTFRDEWFVPGTFNTRTFAQDYDVKSNKHDIEDTDPSTIRLRLPTPGLQMAMDPRIPDSAEYFKFSLTETAKDKPLKKVEWFVNEELVGVTQDGNFMWPLSRGEFKAHAKIIMGSGDVFTTASIPYSVQ